MKKAVVLGMILLALGTFAFADGGATVGMDFGRTQFTVASGQTGSGAPTTITQGWGAGLAGFPNGERIDFQFAWSNQYTGVNATFYVGNGYGNILESINGLPAINVVNLYGTLKLVPDMFTMYIGEFAGDGWDHFRLDSNHPIHDVNNNNVGRFTAWGAILDLMPKDTGFEAALFAKTIGPQTTVKLTPTGSTPFTLVGAFPMYDIGEQLSNYAVAAAYTMPNTVKIMAGTNTFATFSGGPGSSERNVFASVQLLMVPNLTAWDEFYFAGFDQVPSSTIWSDELAVQYVAGQLTAILAAFFGGNSYGGTPDYTTTTNYTGWAVDPEVFYNVGVASVGLYASIGSKSLTNYGINYYVEPYVKLNNFGLRVSFGYSGNTGTPAQLSTWEVPIIIDWGF